MADAWTSNGDNDEPSVASAVEKEKTIQEIIRLRDGLRDIMVRVTDVEGENKKLAKENEMLSLYMDNL